MCKLNLYAFSAKEWRILITLWFCQTFEKLQGNQYDHARGHCLERTGCLITADSSDEKIKPDGIANYGACYTYIIYAYMCVCMYVCVYIYIYISCIH